MQYYQNSQNDKSEQKDIIRFLFCTKEKRQVPGKSQRLSVFIILLDMIAVSSSHIEETLAASETHFLYASQQNPWFVLLPYPAPDTPPEIL